MILEAQILVHIGLETVKLDGKFFKSHVKQGDEVKVGDLLIEFDLEAIKAEGYDTITPVIILNSKEFSNVKTSNLKTTNEKEVLLELFA